jgi:hypothetical protein
MSNEEKEAITSVYFNGMLMQEESDYRWEDEVLLFSGDIMKPCRCGKCPRSNPWVYVTTHNKDNGFISFTPEFKFTSEHTSNCGQLSEGQMQVLASLEDEDNEDMANKPSKIIQFELVKGRADFVNYSLVALDDKGKLWGLGNTIGSGWTEIKSDRK